MIKPHSYVHARRPGRGSPWLACAIVACVGATSAPAARSDVVALWTFNESNFIAEAGAGVMTPAATASFTFVPGTTVAAPPGVSPGQALQISGGNARTLDIAFSTAGHSEPRVSLAWKRNATGYSQISFSYSVNGITFTTFQPNLDPPGDFAAQVVDFAGVTAMADRGQVTVRVLLNGAQSPLGRVELDNVQVTASALPGTCYPNCDGSTAAPVLNVGDFTCFLQKYAGLDPYANCDGSTAAPSLNVGDFTCFLQKYAAGCP